MIIVTDSNRDDFEKNLISWKVRSFGGDDDAGGIGDYTPPPPIEIVTPSINAALATNGAVASASSSFSAQYPDGANNGMRHTNNNWGTSSSEGGWNSGAGLPQTWTVDFGQERNIRAVDVFTLADVYLYNVDPLPTDTFTQFGVTAFDVELLTGGAWVNVASVTGNNLVWKHLEFPSRIATQLRIVCLAAHDPYARLVEVEAWTTTTMKREVITFETLVDELDGNEIAAGRAFWEIAIAGGWGMPRPRIGGRSATLPLHGVSDPVLDQIEQIIANARNSAGRSVIKQERSNKGRSAKTPTKKTAEPKTPPAKPAAEPKKRGRKKKSK